MADHLAWRSPRWQDQHRTVTQFDELVGEAADVTPGQVAGAVGHAAHHRRQARHWPDPSRSRDMGTDGTPWLTPLACTLPHALPGGARSPGHRNARPDPSAGADFGGTCPEAPPARAFGTPYWGLEGEGSFLPRSYRGRKSTDNWGRYYYYLTNSVQIKVSRGLTPCPKRCPVHRTNRTNPWTRAASPAVRRRREPKRLFGARRGMNTIGVAPQAATVRARLISRRSWPTSHMTSVKEAPA